MSWTLTIHLTGGDRTYDILYNGWDFPDEVGAKGAHLTQSLKLTIKSAEAFALFLSETSRLVKAEVKHDNTVMFEGVIRPYLSVSARGNYEEPISVQVMDYTEALHIVSGEDRNDCGGYTLAQCVDYLFNLAGITTTRDYPAAFSSDTVEYLPIKSSEYYDAILTNLLFERGGWDYKFTPGHVKFYKTEAEAQPNTTISDIRDSLSINREDYWADGISVKYMKLKSDDIVLFRQDAEIPFSDSGAVFPARTNPSATLSYPGGVTFTGARGLLYDGTYNAGEPTDEPPSGKGQVSWSPEYNEKSGSEITPVSISNVSVKCSWDKVSIKQENPVADNITVSGARLFVGFKGTFTFNEIPLTGPQWAPQWHITASGHVVYLCGDSEEYVENTTGSRPENTTRTLKYVYDSTMAQNYAKRELKRQKTAGITYSFKSLTAYEAGTFHLLNDSVTGVQTTVRVLSCRQAANGIYTIKAEGADIFSLPETVLKALYYSDMFRVAQSDFRIISDLTDLAEGQTANLQLAGAVVNAGDDVTFSWKLNGVSIGTGKTKEIAASSLSSGSNEVTCSIVYNSNVIQTASITLNLDGASQVVPQFYVSTSKMLVQGGSWLNGYPYGYSGYLWRRLKIVNSNGGVTYTDPVYILKLEDVDTNLVTNEIQYGLSTSDIVYNFPSRSFGYDEDSDEFEFGFEDVAEWTSDYDNWYKGLYVWQRLKTTDADGVVTYGEPTYAKSTTEALINGCILDIVVIDSDGDGDTHTWEKNLADSTTDVLLQFKLISRSYQSITAFKSALQSLSLSFCKASAVFSNVVLTNVTPSAENFDDANNLVTLTYSYTFKKNVNADSIVINALIEDGYLKEDGTTYSLETTATSTLNSVDVTEFDVFGGLFATDAIAEQYFQEQNGGLLEGYTYAVSDTTATDYLSLRTYVNGSWVSLSTSGLPSTRISGICSKAQKTVLSMVQTGSVTATDYGYFNILIANVVTADFIGAKKINLQNNGVIWGGGVTLQNDVPLKGSDGYYTIDDDGGFVIDSDGLMQAVGAKFEKITIGRESKLYGEVINSTSGGTEVFRTIMDEGDTSNIAGANTGNAGYLASEWKTHLLSWFASNMTAGTRYGASGSFITSGNNSVTIQEAIRLTSLGSSVTNYSQSSNQEQTVELFRSSWSKKTIRLPSVTVKRGYRHNGGSINTVGALRLFIRKSDSTETSLVNVPSEDYVSISPPQMTWTLSNVDIPAGATLYVTYGYQSTTFVEYQVGTATVSYSDADNFTVGVNLIDSGGDTYNMDDYYVYDSSGNPSYLGGSTSFTVGSATTTTASALTPFYKLAYSTAPSGTLVSSLFSAKSFTVNGVDKTSLVSSINATSTAITITTTDGSYTFRTGSFASKGAFSFSFSTLADALGAKAKNLMPIDSSGSVGSAGTKWNAVYANYVDGSSSARKNKHDIHDYLGDAIDIIKRTKVVSYVYNENIEPSGQIRYGFIADDTPEELATPSHNKMDTGSCIGILIKAVQELSAELDRLKGV